LSYRKLFLGFTIFSGIVSGQLLFVEDRLNAYLDYLITAGKYQPNYVLNQPYDLQELDTTSTLLNELNSRGLHGLPGHYDGLDLKLYGGYGATTRGEGDHTLKLNGILRYHDGPFSFVNQTGVDRSFLYDIHYPGELSEAENWIYGRVANAYFRYSGERIGAFIGRMQRNWGPLNEKSLILSDNPYSYDHANVSFTNSNIKVSVFAARINTLDSAYTYHFQDSSISLTSNVKRYLTGHRLDIRASENMQISFTEMAIFGGPNRNYDLSFLVPTAFYYDIQRNTVRSMSGQWALDVYYRFDSNWALSSQFLIDDIVINNDPGIDDRARYPDRLGLALAIKNADALLDGLHTSLTYVRIWNHTYQSRDSWENYHSRGLRLGYPYAALEQLKLKLGYWGWNDIWFTCELDYGRYGSAGVRDVFRLQKDGFPLEPVDTSFHQKLYIQYNYAPSVVIRTTAEMYSSLISQYAQRYTDINSAMISIEIDLQFSRHFIF
jgi:hypothetical protein